MRRLVYLLLLAACSREPSAPAPQGNATVATDPEHARIEKLLERIRTSGITFIRNGSDHTAERAAEHLRSKWEGARGRVKTAEDFIEHLGTRSSSSGELYLVRLTDGQERPAGEWMREILGTP